MQPKLSISPAQCRGARAMLGWAQAEVAFKAGAENPAPVKRFEDGSLDEAAGRRWSLVLRRVFEEAGVCFYGRHGVSLGGEAGGPAGTPARERGA